MPAASANRVGCAPCVASAAQIAAEIGHADEQAERDPGDREEERRHVGRARGAALQRLEHLADRLAVVIGGALRRLHLFEVGGRRAAPEGLAGSRRLAGILQEKVFVDRGRRAGRTAPRGALGFDAGRHVGERIGGGRCRRRWLGCGGLRRGRRRRRVLTQVEGLLDRRHCRFGRILNSFRIIRHVRPRPNALQGIAARTGPTLGPHSGCVRAANPSPSAGGPCGQKPPSRHPNALRERMKPDW